MFTIVISLLLGAVVGVAFRASGLVHSVAGAIAPAVVAMLGCAILLLRRVGKRLQPLAEAAQRHLQAGNKELALKSLRDGLRWSKWSPLIEGQLRTQIGVLLYASGDVDGAIAELERGSSRPWEGRAFLGAAYFRKRRDEKAMCKQLEKAVKLAPKEGVAWTLYAYCLLTREKKKEALAVLERAKKALPNDQRIDNHIEAIKEGKKLKVAPYGATWAAFGVDGSVPVQSDVPKHMRGFAQKPGFRQKPQRKRK